MECVYYAVQMKPSVKVTSFSIRKRLMIVTECLARCSTVTITQRLKLSVRFLFAQFGSADMETPSLETWKSLREVREKFLLKS